MPKTKTNRDAETYRILRPLDADTYAGLKANIAVNGVQVPIVKDERGNILDGFARAKIAGELGYECPSVTVRGLSEQEKRSQVRALNLARRHLDCAARRQVIADEIRENPDRSNRWIAKSLGVDHKTVASVRKPIGATGEAPQLDYRLGADGKFRPATRYQGANDHASHSLAASPDLLDRHDEEAILAAAAEIRQRRVAQRLREIQERRRSSRPARAIKAGGPVLHGDCLDLIPTLADTCDGR